MGGGKPTLLRVVPNPRSGRGTPSSQQDGGTPISGIGFPPPAGWTTPVQVPDQDGGEVGTPNWDIMACTCYVDLIVSFFFFKFIMAISTLGG